MIKLICIHPDGERTELQAQRGTSLMQAAVAGGTQGVLAECGGACQCATCHVYVESPWKERLQAPSEMELAMLDSTYLPPLPTSRLSCEIQLTDDLDGLEFRLPERQV